MDLSRWPKATDRWQQMVPSRLVQEDLFFDGKILADFAKYLQREQKLPLAAKLWLLAAARFGPDPTERDAQAAGRLACELEASWDSYLQAPDGCCSDDDAQACFGDCATSSSSRMHRTASRSSAVPEYPVVPGGHIVDHENMMYEFAVSAMVGIRVAVECQATFDGAFVSATGADTAADVDALWKASFSDLNLVECLQNACVSYQVPPEGTPYSAATSAVTAGRLTLPFVIEDYCPQLFAQVRRLSGISNDQVFRSLCRPDVELVEFKTNSRSGEFFFFSHDSRFLLKTITRREAEVLIRMLPDMIRRFGEAPHSLLCRYLGLYHIQQTNEEFDLLFAVMASVTQNTRPVHLAYDLKGSTRGRLSMVGELVGKDLNFKRDVGTLLLSPHVAQQLMRTHSEDLEILQRHAVLDYSVLLHVFDSRAPPGRSLFRQQSEGHGQGSQGMRHNATQHSQVRLATGHIPVSQSILVSVAGPGLAPTTRNEGHEAGEGAAGPAPDWNPAEGVWSSDGRFLYTLGLIDLLIPYYWKKKIEAASYEVIYCGSTAAASAVAPEAYAERQIAMMERICMASKRSDDVDGGGEAAPVGFPCPCFRRLPGRRSGGHPSDGETTDVETSEDTSDDGESSSG